MLASPYSTDQANRSTGTNFAHCLPARQNPARHALPSPPPPRGSNPFQPALKTWKKNSVEALKPTLATPAQLQLELLPRQPSSYNPSSGYDSSTHIKRISFLPRLSNHLQLTHDAVPRLVPLKVNLAAAAVRADLRYQPHTVGCDPAPACGWRDAWPHAHPGPHRDGRVGLLGRTHHLSKGGVEGSGGAWALGWVWCR